MKIMSAKYSRADINPLKGKNRDTIARVATSKANFDEELPTFQKISKGKPHGNRSQKKSFVPYYA